MKFAGNKYDLSGEYGIGYTSNGEPFYFDKEDFHLIAPYTWYLTSEKYVATTVGRKTILQHRLIMNCCDSFEIDHIYHINYDNRKSQLRYCDTQQNCMNRSLRSDNHSGKTGVRWHKRNQKWEARIYKSKKYYCLGYFNHFDDAVKAREKAEKELFGDFRYKEVI